VQIYDQSYDKNLRITMRYEAHVRKQEHGVRVLVHVENMENTKNTEKKLQCSLAAADHSISSRCGDTKQDTKFERVSSAFRRIVCISQRRTFRCC
jgi:hypothetical protein